jgi:hypothetical protein
MIAAADKLKYPCGRRVPVLAGCDVHCDDRVSITGCCIGMRSLCPTVSVIAIVVVVSSVLS